MPENLSERSEGYCIKVYSQNSRGLKATNLEEVLATSKTQSVFAWCLQETWRLDNYITKHDGGYYCLYHGPKEKLSRRGSLGVAIMLSPQAWKGFLDGGHYTPFGLEQKDQVYGRKFWQQSLIRG
jgi:hypothetical protein